MIILLYYTPMNNINAKCSTDDNALSKALHTLTSLVGLCGDRGRMLPLNEGEKCNLWRSELGHHTIHTANQLTAEDTAKVTV